MNNDIPQFAVVKVETKTRDGCLVITKSVVMESDDKGLCYEKALELSQSWPTSSWANYYVVEN